MLLDSQIDWEFPEEGTVSIIAKISTYCAVPAIEKASNNGWVDTKEKHAVNKNGKKHTYDHLED